MEISAKKLKMLRQERGWSQEHVAEIAGLSYRTIQRIEKDGHCSLESKMALASAFVVTPVELTDEKAHQIGSGKLQWSSIIGLVVCITLGVMALELGGGLVMAIDTPSLLIAILFPIGLSLISNGSSQTIKAISLLTWSIYEPRKKQNIALSLSVLRKLIIYSYTTSAMSALFAFLSTVNFYNDMNQSQLMNSLQVVVLPLVYGTVLAEVFIRPVHHRFSRMLFVGASE